MATGISIHIGLNRVDPGHYQGWDGKLKGCENDACAMEAIASKQKFATSLLLNEQATAQAVKDAIAGAVNQLKSGDILLLTYSGHGGQVPDLNGDEEDHLDETWVLYDHELIDDELYALWGQFETDVRILLLTDSCHSGRWQRSFETARYSPASRRRTCPSARHAGGRRRAHVRGEQGVLRPTASRQPSRQPRWHRRQRDPDLRLPGQPGLAGWASEWRLHRSAAQDVERREVQGEHPEVPQEHSEQDRVLPKPQLLQGGAFQPTFERQRPFTI